MCCCSRLSVNLNVNMSICNKICLFFMFRIRCSVKVLAVPVYIKKKTVIRLKSRCLSHFFIQ